MLFALFVLIGDNRGKIYVFHTLKNILLDFGVFGGERGDKPFDF